MTTTLTRLCDHPDCDQVFDLPADPLPYELRILCPHHRGCTATGILMDDYSRDDIMCAMMDLFGFREMEFFFDDRTIHDVRAKDKIDMLGMVDYKKHPLIVQFLS